MTRTLAEAVTAFARDYLMRRLMHEGRDVTALEALNTGHLLHLYHGYLSYAGIAEPLFDRIEVVGKPLVQASIGENRIFRNIMDGTKYLLGASRVGGGVMILESLRDRAWYVTAGRFENSYVNQYYLATSVEPTGHNRFYDSDALANWYMVSATALAFLDVAVQGGTADEMAVVLDEDDERWLAELLDWFMMFYPKQGELVNAA